MLQPYPIADSTQINTSAIDEINWVMEFILGIRRIRGEMNIAPGKPLAVLLENGSARDQAYVTNSQSYLLRLSRLESITWLDNATTAPESAIALVGDMKILIPMAGLIDKEAELSRLEKEITKIEKDLPRIEGKLSNPAFVDKAPEDVIAKEREKLASLQSSLNNLREQFLKIKAL
jgi:valyl-tRNA synthetase